MKSASFVSDKTQITFSNEDVELLTHLVADAVKYSHHDYVGLENELNDLLTKLKKL